MIGILFDYFVKLKEERNKMELKDFEIGKVLGKGSFGIVYLATHKETSNEEKTNVALKIYSGSKEKTEKYKQSTRIASLYLKHENFVRCGHLFYDQGSLVSVMEYIDGIQIDKVEDIQRLEKMGNYIKQMKDAMNYLKMKKLVHRDIKCENIMITNAKHMSDNGIVKFIDYDFLKYEQKDSYTQVGTPLYAAPEIYKETDSIHECDLWSLGVTIYYCLSKQFPFDADSALSLKMLLLSDEQADLTVIPEEYRKTVKYLLEKDVKKRKFI